MGRVIVCGDIHSSHKALIQCLERSNFDYENDTLIQLGDICDGWNETYECVEELLKITNKILITGNHDQWYKEWLVSGINPVNCLQGGQGTLDSYCRNLDKSYTTRMNGFISNLNPGDIPKSHIDFFNKQVRYYKDENNNIFVHGGFDRHSLLKDQLDDEIFWWDRNLWNQALSAKNGVFKIKEPCNTIYIGHTATVNWGTDYLMQACNIINLDTGGGFGGKLSFYDINTKEVWQSDKVNLLHENWKGR